MHVACMRVKLWMHDIFIRFIVDSGSGTVEQQYMYKYNAAAGIGLDVGLS